MTPRVPEIFVESSGTGPNVVLLHGAPTSLEYMRLLGDQLCSEFCVHLVHLPGYGRTPALNVHPSLERVQEYVDAALLDRGISSAMFVGYSLGGYRAILSVLAGRLAARGLLILSGLVRLSPEERDVLPGTIAFLRGPHAGQLVEALPARMLSPAHLKANPQDATRVKQWLVDTSPAVVADELEALLGASDIVDRLGAVTVAAMWRSGELDLPGPPAQAALAAQRMPHLRVSHPAGVGHALFYEDLPGTVEAALGFLRGCR